MMFMRLGLMGALLATGCLSRPLAEVSPATNNLYVDQIKQTAVDKIDLLFMIDNSTSMSDKQEILKDAVPVLLKRLVFPICVDSAGKPTGDSAQANGQCPNNKDRPEFNPIGDIHIGIVSSSLGGHGGDQCKAPTLTQPNTDDQAHLIGSVRPTQFPLSKTWNNSGFLAWDSSGHANTPPGTTDANTLNMAFPDMIEAIGEQGCGYEASLESWYRFLVDPEPPATVDKVNLSSVRSSKLTVNPDGSTGACVGCDETLLAQRKLFLRPDSLVAIVMLSDENDCSIRDDSAGWLVGSGSLKGATSQCDANPNDPCCRWCGQDERSGPPAGCPALADDPACKKVESAAELAARDSPNLRCYDQRRRYGFDLLYPIERYVSALTQTTIRLQSNPEKIVNNPLFDGGGSGRAPRDPSLVFLAGIVGVPWQDIADDASLTGAGLNYLTAKQLKDKGRWAALIGDPEATPARAPSDPFMVETPEVRQGTNDIARVSISPATSGNPRENPINGHEHAEIADDLQFACTFRLKTPKTCTEANGLNCDCSPKQGGDSSALVTTNSPLCQGGANINTQTFAKAYPGTRELSVLKGLGDNAIVASICPKVIDAADPANPSADPNYGYNPAVSAILARLKISLAGQCLPRELKTDDHGQVLCRVIEAQKQGCDCNLAGRAAASDDLRAAVQSRLKLTGQCGQPGQPSCNDWCVCEIEQVDSAHLKACQAKEGGVPPGYCYIDDQAKTGLDASAAQGVDSELSLCKPDQRHRLRFVDADSAHKTPANGAFAFIACVGDAIASAEAAP